MPRRAANVTQADISRAIRAMRAAGYDDLRVVMRGDAVVVERARATRGPDHDLERGRADERKEIVL